MPGRLALVLVAALGAVSAPAFADAGRPDRHPRTERDGRWDDHGRDHRDRDDLRDRDDRRADPRAHDGRRDDRRVPDDDRWRQDPNRWNGPRRPTPPEWDRHRALRPDRHAHVQYARTYDWDRHPWPRQHGIPAGHLPAPGTCRVWFPGVPPGQQPPPMRCDDAWAWAPAGAWVVVSDRRTRGVEAYVVHPAYDHVFVRRLHFDPAGRLLATVRL